MGTHLVIGQRSS